MLPSKFLLAAAVGLCLPCLALAQANVLTYHNDNTRAGANLNETILTPANVTAATFGKLFSHSVDGYVYAQPLYVSGLAIPGQGTHNAVFVATEHNTVYCFDADSNAGANGGVLWQSNLGPSAPCPVDGFRFEAITNEVGITGTPVIDPVTQTLYVDTFILANGNYSHQIHALNITDGSEKSFSPVTVEVSIPGVGAGSANGVLPFQAIQELQRSALTLAGGVLYVAYAGYTDTTLTDPFHGWIIGFDASNLQLLQDHVFNTTPNGTTSQYGAIAGEGGIWMAGGGLAVDSDTNLYFSTGDGNFNAYSGGTEYGSSVVKLSTANGLSVADYFASYNQEFYRLNDLDIGSGGVMLLPDQPGQYPHLMIAGGKPQYAYLMNRDQLTTDNGHYNAGGSSDNILQTMSLGGASFSTPAYFNGRIYYIGNRDAIRSYIVTNGTLIPDQPGTFGTRIFPFPGATPSISANGNTNGIAWAIQNTNNGPAILVAWNAANLSSEIYNSSQSGVRDQPGKPVKFTVPTVAGGKVFVGSQFNLSVYGLLGGGLQFSSSNYTAQQTDSTARITVNRVGGSTGAVQVGYTTASGGTAIAGQDYIATSGVLNWANGDTAPKTFSVTLLGNQSGGTNKTVFLALSNTTGSAYLGSQSSAVLSIVNLGGTLEFSSTNYTAQPNDTSATITVNRLGGSAGAAQVTYATTTDGTAIAGQDYVATSGTLNWADGDTASKTFSITLLSNQSASTNKTIFLTLSNATGSAYLSPQTNAILTILESAGSLQFSSTNYTAQQTDSAATITVDRVGGSAGAVQVDYQTAPGGTAVPDVDYTDSSGTLNWIAGDTASKTFTVTLLNNQQAGTNRTVFLTLSNATGGASLSSPTNAVLTIIASPLPPYTFWKQNHFGANANNPAIAGDAADPDGDGIVNALEYAFGSDPNSADAARPLLGNIIANHFALQFNRNIAATDTTYTVLATLGVTNTWSNLVTYLPGNGWVTNTPGATVTESESPGSSPDQHVQVTITDPVDTTDPTSTNRFFQLKVQH
jgi:Calx-beta domain-containing protein